jgi:hypothetical protein
MHIHCRFKEEFGLQETESDLDRKVNIITQKVKGKNKLASCQMCCGEAQLSQLQPDVGDDLLTFT